MMVQQKSTNRRQIVCGHNKWNPLVNENYGEMEATSRARRDAALKHDS